MKRILLPLIFLLPFLSSAQNDWAPVGAKWNYTLVDFGGPEIYNATMRSVSDTIINGINCRKLTGSVGCNDLSYNGTFIYSDSNRVYYYSPYLNDFYLLYDLNLNPNESYSIIFNNLQADVDSINLTITDTSSIQINGEYYKTQEFQQTSQANYFISGTIIEKIGSDFFFFYQIGFCDPPTGPLRCYEDSVIGLYETGNAPSCNWTNVGINESQISQLEIFPNPAHDFLYIKSTSPKLNYKILDYTGRVILSGKTEKEINLQTLSPGYYRVVFEDEVSRAFLKM